MTQKKEVTIKNARTDEYAEKLKNILARGICPFCPEHLKEFFPEEPLYQNDDWYLFKNQVPIKNTLQHLLVISKTHGTTMQDVSIKKIGNSFFEVIAWAEEHFKIPGGAIGFRFGDMDFSAGTVSHTHAQIIVPDIHTLKKDELVVFYIGKPLKNEK